MTESDYIIATNRVKITIAKNIIVDVLSGDDWGVSDGQRKALLDVLYTIEDRLFSMIKTEGDMDEQV